MKKVIHLIKFGFLLLKRNFWTLFVFEIIYKLLVFGIAQWALRGCIGIAMHAQQLAYISDETVGQIIKSPVSWIFVVIYVLGWSFLTLFDISCIITCFHASYRGQKISLVYMMKHAAAATLRMLVHKGNIMLIVYLLIIVPMTHSIFISGYIATFDVPEFIQDYIYAKPLLAAAYVGFWIFMGLKSQEWMYGLHVATLERCSYTAGKNKSKKMIKGFYIKDVLCWVLSAVAFSLIYSGVIRGMGMLVDQICVKLDGASVLSSLLLSLISLFVEIWGVLGFALSLPAMYLILSVMFYHRKHRRKEAMPGSFENINESYKISQAAWVRWIAARSKRVIAVTIAVVIGVGFAVNLADRNGFLQPEHHQVEVLAHRGYAAEYPENTLPAFTGAIEIGADAAELDVQQTKDGVLVICHDANIKRVTGKNINIYDVDYAQIADLDAGSWFDKKYKNIRLATLEDVLKAAKGKIDLNIEIKTTGHEREIERSVIELLEKYDMKDQCLISSMEYQVLVNVKEVDPEMETAYITSVSFGDFTVLDAADGYSVEETMLTRGFVRRAHAANKKIYVWTVNTQNRVETALNRGVDAIISDDPVMVRSSIDQVNERSGWEKFLGKVIDAGS